MKSANQYWLKLFPTANTDNRNIPFPVSFDDFEKIILEVQGKLPKGQPKKGLNIIEAFEANKFIKRKGWNTKIFADQDGSTTTAVFINRNEIFLTTEDLLATDWESSDD